MIYPIIIWPFLKPVSAEHCEALVDFFAKMESDERLGTPTIVINHRAEEWLIGRHADNFQRARSRNWRIHWVWSVDTCQTWLDAFGTSHLLCSDSDFSVSQPAGENHAGQHYGECRHLIVPADFHYATQAGKKALVSMSEEFNRMSSPNFDLALGQIHTRQDNFKELVDSLGTWELLKLWFPEEEVVLRKKLITKPCSEFLAFSGKFLEASLKKRWFPYSQTLIMLLRLVRASTIDRVHTYDLGELVEDLPRDPYMEFVTQVERTERALKLSWRDSIDTTSDWRGKYTELIHASHLRMEDIFASSKKIFLALQDG